MIAAMIRVLGLAPADTRTGKRETAWGLVLIATGLTVYSFYIGAAMVSAATPILSILWTTSLIAICGAYKLDYDRKQNPNIMQNTTTMKE